MNFDEDIINSHSLKDAQTVVMIDIGGEVR